MRLRNAIMASLGLIVLGLAFFYWRHITAPARCDKLGGRWGSVESRCITRDCYDDETCGEWATPANRCEFLKPGVPEREVYFQLGQPMRVEGNRRFWKAYKAESLEIEAEIEGGKLKHLRCPNSPSF